jgi:hypothetical protein
MTNMRTTEQQAALDLITDTLRPHVGDMLNQYAELLADVPDEDLDREIANRGHCMVLAFDQVAPNVSEPLR